MSVRDWSESIVLVDLQDDPQFGDDLNAAQDLIRKRNGSDLVLDMSGVNYLNSSNIARLLKIRKLLQTDAPGRMKLCGMNTSVWGVFLVTGLDKIFDFCDDVPSGLASLQMEPR
ncbi:MAG: STAS domain-containing protein [Planctomycetes bacterium]|nr:STAS domain-containing protein [Planctomycetota bacterium]